MPPDTPQPFLMKSCIAAAVLKITSTSFSTAPSWKPALAPPIFMKVFFFVLLSCTTPVPPLPPMMKLTP